jgi:energy-coupling factor transport system ATP-binding protein
MDRAHRAELLAALERYAGAGAAVVVATHDAELAAAFAERVVLLGEGTVIADGPTRDILSGGWYFATETARVLGGAGKALLPADGAELLLRGRTPVEVTA